MTCLAAISTRDFSTRGQPRLGQLPVSEPDPTQSGWFVPPKLYKHFLYLTGHEPPRPFAIWDQFCLDARHWQMTALWLLCAWQVVNGAATRQWLEIAVGAAILALWLACLLIVASRSRTCSLAVGVIGSYSWHWQFKMSKAKAVMADGREIDVIVPTSLAKTFVHGGRKALVLFLDETKPGSATCCLGFAMRAMPEGPLVDAARELQGPDATK
jgi:hypothetical protein